MNEKVHHIMLCFQITDNWFKIPKHFLVCATQIYIHAIPFFFKIWTENEYPPICPYEFIISKHIIYFLKSETFAWDFYRRARCLFLIFFFISHVESTPCVTDPFFHRVFFSHGGCRGTRELYCKTVTVINTPIYCILLLNLLKLSLNLFYY